MMYDSTWPTKYRPRRFDEVEGQADRVFLYQLLRRGSELPPVILLAGGSGVGKTTIARITAAALNCTERYSEGEPCGECETCRSVFAGSNMSVVEIDAATRSGADDMRMLRAQSFNQTPGVRVFIIDEAHSLSGQAWNVLLKLFEEPPEGVVFFLLTSEPFKVPVKIRTRAMRLDFGRIVPEKIRKRLIEIGKAEGVFEGDSLPEEYEIAVELSEGSLREAIKLFEQCCASEDFLESLSLRDKSFEIIHAAVRRDHAEGLRILNETYAKTDDIKGIMEMWAVAMEKVLFHKHDLPMFVSGRKKGIVSALASGMTDMQWAAGMEVLSDWASRAVSRAHLSFVWSEFVKALHGPTVVPLADLSAQPEEDEITDDFAAYVESHFG